jgi:hypothetical protein
MSKKQNLHTQFFAKKKINWLNQLIIKLACLMQHRQKYEAKIVMKVLVLKLKIKCVNSRISGSQSFCGSFMIPVTTFIYCDVCRKAGQDITGKTKFVESLDY